MASVIWDLTSRFVYETANVDFKVTVQKQSEPFRERDQPLVGRSKACPIACRHHRVQLGTIGILPNGPAHGDFEAFHSPCSAVPVRHGDGPPDCRRTKQAVGLLVSTATTV